MSAFGSSFGGPGGGTGGAPDPHKSTHETGGSDALTPAGIGAETADAAIQSHITSAHAPADATSAGATGDAHAVTAHAPANAEQNVQADWNQATSSADDYIKNKPTSMAPTAHKASHETGGTDALYNQALNTTSDVTFASMAIGGVVDTINIEYPVVEIKDINNVVVASVTVQFSSLTSGAQTGVMRFYVMRSGTLTNILELDGGGA